MAAWSLKYLLQVSKAKDDIGYLHTHKHTGWNGLTAGETNVPVIPDWVTVLQMTSQQQNTAMEVMVLGNAVSIRTQVCCYGDVPRGEKMQKLGNVGTSYGNKLQYYTCCSEYIIHCFELYTGAQPIFFSRGRSAPYTYCKLYCWDRVLQINFMM